MMLSSRSRQCYRLLSASPAGVASFVGACSASRKVRQMAHVFLSCTECAKKRSGERFPVRRPLIHEVRAPRPKSGAASNPPPCARHRSRPPQRSGCRPCRRPRAGEPRYPVTRLEERRQDARRVVLRPVFCRPSEQRLAHVVLALVVLLLRGVEPEERERCRRLRRGPRSFLPRSRRRLHEVHVVELRELGVDHRERVPEGARPHGCWPPSSRCAWGQVAQLPCRNPVGVVARTVRGDRDWLNLTRLWCMYSGMKRSSGPILSGSCRALPCDVLAREQASAGHAAHVDVRDGNLLVPAMPSTRATGITPSPQRDSQRTRVGVRDLFETPVQRVDLVAVGNLEPSCEASGSAGALP